MFVQLVECENVFTEYRCGLTKLLMDRYPVHRNSDVMDTLPCCRFEDKVFARYWLSGIAAGSAGLSASVYADRRRAHAPRTTPRRRQS